MIFQLGYPAGLPQPRRIMEQEEHDDRATGRRSNPLPQQVIGTRKTTEILVSGAIFYSVADYGTCCYFGMEALSVCLSKASFYNNSLHKIRSDRACFEAEMWPLQCTVKCLGTPHIDSGGHL